jgi:hypothetical protein
MAAGPTAGSKKKPALRSVDLADARIIGRRSCWAVRHLVQFPSTSRGRVRRAKIHVISPVEHHLTTDHISFMIYGSSRLSGILS